MCLEVASYTYPHAALAHLMLQDMNIPSFNYVYDSGSIVTQSTIYHHLCLCVQKYNTLGISQHTPHAVFSIHTHGSALSNKYVKL